MNALFSIYLALLEPGDEVLLPTPGFPNMDEMVRLLGGEPVFYRPRPRRRAYLPSREQLEPLVTARTKAIFANTPGNPTGAVFPAETVRGLAELAAERGRLADLRRGVRRADPRRPAARVRGRARAGRAGRLGLQLLEGLRDDGLAARLLRRAAAARRRAAQAAGAGGLVPVRDLAARRRGGARAGRATSSTRCATPTASGATGRSRRPRRTGSTCSARRAPSTCSSTSRPSGLPAREFTLRLLDELHVAVAPGEVFGPGGEGLVRISFAVEADVLAEGMSRLARAIETFAA